MPHEGACVPSTDPRYSNTCMKCGKILDSFVEEEAKQRNFAEESDLVALAAKSHGENPPAFTHLANTRPVPDIEPKLIAADLRNALIQEIRDLDASAHDAEASDRRQKRLIALSSLLATYKFLD